MQTVSALRIAARRDTWGKLIKEKRLNSGLSQGKLATILGYSTSQFVSNWERGLASPPPKAIPALTASLKLQRSDLESVITEMNKKVLDIELVHFLGPVVD